MKTAIEILQAGGKARKFDWCENNYITLNKDNYVVYDTGDNYCDTNLFRPIWEEYKEPTKWWEPCLDEKVFILTSAGNYYQTVYTGSHAENNDRHILNQGNMFKTIQDVINEIKLRTVIYRLKKAFFKTCNSENGWIDNEENWNITLYKKELDINIFRIYRCLPSWMHCRTKKQCKKLLEDYEDDLLFWLNQ